MSEDGFSLSESEAEQSMTHRLLSVTAIATILIHVDHHHINDGVRLSQPMTAELLALPSFQL